MRLRLQKKAIFSIGTVVTPAMRTTTSRLLHFPSPTTDKEESISESFVPSTRAHVLCRSFGGSPPYTGWSPLAEVVCVKRCGRREAFASGGAGGRSGRRRLHFRVSAPGDTRSVVRRACHFRVRIDLYTQKALEDTFRSSGHSENRSSYFSAMDKKLYVTVFAHIAAWVSERCRSSTAS